MRIAFYAPMKPPTHPSPSGDRETARLLMRALRRAGADVALASRLRAYDGQGDGARQDRIRRTALARAGRIAARMKSEGAIPDIWVTYHLYHKAPDWIGPEVYNFGTHICI